MKMDRNRQYLGQILAMAARRRLTKMATIQQPWIRTRKFILCPITFTVIRKHICLGQSKSLLDTAAEMHWNKSSQGLPLREIKSNF